MIYVFSHLPLSLSLSLFATHEKELLSKTSITQLSLKTFLGNLSYGVVMRSFAFVWKWITKRSISYAKNHIQNQNENGDWEDKTFILSFLEIVNVIMQMRQTVCIQDGFDVSDFSRKVDKMGKSRPYIGLYRENNNFLGRRMPAWSH